MPKHFRFFWGGGKTLENLKDQEKTFIFYYLYKFHNSYFVFVVIFVILEIYIRSCNAPGRCNCSSLPQNAHATLPRAGTAASLNTSHEAPRGACQGNTLDMKVAGSVIDMPLGSTATDDNHSFSDFCQKSSLRAATCPRRSGAERVLINSFVRPNAVNCVSMTNIKQYCITQ